MGELVGIEQIQTARELAKGVWVETPLEYSRVLSDASGGPVYLKCENLQRTGSFKIRGAYTMIHGLSDQEKAAGVVAASAGNHAQGVALAATTLGVKSTVFMPEGASIPKVAATKRYGADAVLAGGVYDDAYAAAVEFSKKSGAVMVHPFDHLDVIAGQGTVALEVLEQLPDVASIVVPVGGGGLISGIAAAAKALKPDIVIIGVEPVGAANVSLGLEKGEPVDLDEVSTFADALAAKKSGAVTLEHVKKFVDEVVTVTDDEIAEALLLMVERAKLVVEPGGATGVAVVMTGRAVLPKPSVVIASGGNIDPLLLLKVLRFGMGSAGRYFAFRTRVKDAPGELHRLLGVVAEEGGNVVGVEHHREGSSVRHLFEVEIAVQVETGGHDHVRDIKAKLYAAGYAVEDL